MKTAKTPGIATKSEFAAIVRVAKSTVSNWVRRRKITAPALRPDGKIDVEKAKAQLAASVGYGRSPGEASATARSAGAEDGNASRLAKARADLLELKARDAAISRRLATGELVPVDEADREMSTQLANLIVGIEVALPSWVGIIASAPDDEAALARLRAGIESLWYRELGGENGHATH